MLIKLHGVRAVRWALLPSWAESVSTNDGWRAQSLLQPRRGHGNVKSKEQSHLRCVCLPHFLSYFPLQKSQRHYKQLWFAEENLGSAPSQTEVLGLKTNIRELRKTDCTMDIELGHVDPLEKVWLMSSHLSNIWICPIYVLLSNVSLCICYCFFKVSWAFVSNRNSSVKGLGVGALLGHFMICIGRLAFGV